ncbi:Plug domain-containing protein [Pseudoalteromonas luteoviolacea]|uniref:TonB-dependent receptor-like beta-barrel domain-containing protein n=1 Tax=Pseudoalteromonas luteoviolacea NCIMB 1942 TaxID=1365253 RepID=A0A167BG78_9GAMM|nr:Plug domain-containing protein [Pseudoalteromonas luteoviolacea]KZN46501.1 hypothetical protein N482_11970 [Pseudoalteromonas luteoviolacea NCIMB 1942]
MEKSLNNRLSMFGALLCALIAPVSAALDYTDTQSTIDTPQFAVINYDNQALEQLYGQNALDKIEQIPGFALVQNTASRGLSAAGGNVLINGAMPASKSESLSQILSQLPAAHITALHFYSTGHPFGSASQYNQVINVLTHTSSITTNWQTHSKLTSAYQQYRPSELAAQFSVPMNAWKHQINIHYQDDRYQSVSTIESQSAQKIITEVGSEDFFEKLNSRLLSLNSTRYQATNRLVLSAKALQDDWQTDFYRLYGSMHHALNQTWQYNESIDTMEYEFSADWLKKLSQDKQLQLVALQNKKTTNNQSVTRETGEQNDVFKQYKSHQEQVMLFSFTAPRSFLKPEVGIEISRNQLDAVTQASGSQIASRVSEIRYLPFVAFTYTMNSQWKLYTRLNTEHTKLKSTTASTHRSDLNFMKPLLRLSYESKNSWDFALTARRHVDQLDFNHFVASQDAGFDRSQSGNHRLQPSQFSELAAQLNARLMDSLFISLKVFNQWQKDIHEVVTLTNGSAGLGNAGNATLLGSTLSSTLSTDNLLSGSQLSLDYEYSTARYHDPLTGTRATTGLTPHSASIEFRRDMPNYSWGVDITLPESATYFYQDEIFVERDHTEINAFGEYTLSDSLRVKVAVSALNSAKYTYTQTYFDSRRGEIFDGETRFNDQVKPVVTVSLTGTL